MSNDSFSSFNLSIFSFVLSIAAIVPVIFFSAFFPLEYIILAFFPMLWFKSKYMVWLLIVIKTWLVEGIIFSKNSVPFKFSNFAFFNLLLIMSHRYPLFFASSNTALKFSKEFKLVYIKSPIS